MFDEQDNLNGCFDVDIDYIGVESGDVASVLLEHTVESGSYIQLTFKEVEAIYLKMKQLKTMENV